MDRIGEVVQIVQSKRTGATVEEIVGVAKAGLVTDQEAIRALERDYWEAEKYRQTRERPIGAAIEEKLATEYPPDNTEGEVLRREVINVLLRVINGLPKRQAQCVELYYLDGYTQEQIAERLGVSRDTVQTHLTRALPKLEAALYDVSTKSPTNAIYSEGIYVADLLRSPARKVKRHRTLRFPFEIWMRWCTGAAWRDNGVYAPHYENRLREYLSDCFGGDPPLVGRFSNWRAKP